MTAADELAATVVTHHDDAATFHQEAARAASDFPHRSLDVDGDWASIQTALTWTSEMRHLFDDAIPDSLVRRIAEHEAAAPDPGELTDALARARETHQQLAEEWDDAPARIRDIATIEWNLAQEELTQLRDTVEDVDAWIAYRRAAQAIDECGWSKVLKHLTTTRIARDALSRHSHAPTGRAGPKASKAPTHGRPRPRRHPSSAPGSRTSRAG